MFDVLILQLGAGNRAGNKAGNETTVHHVPAQWRGRITYHLLPLTLVSTLIFMPSVPLLSVCELLYDRL